MNIHRITFAFSAVISYNKATCGVFEKLRSDLGYIKNIQIEVRFQSRQNLRIMIVIRRFCFLPSACTSYTGANCSLFHKYYFKTQVWAERTDMYPLYWTPSRGGIIMRYTYEYKRKCVELYREGKWPETPEGVSDKSFRDKVDYG